MNSILGMAYDGSVLVRREVVAALSRFVLNHQGPCHEVVSVLLIQDDNSGGSQPQKRYSDQSPVASQISEPRSSNESVGVDEYGQQYDRVSFIDASISDLDEVHRGSLDNVASSTPSLSDEGGPPSLYADVSVPPPEIPSDRMEELYQRTWYVLNGICLDPFADIAFAVSHLITALTTSVEQQAERSQSQKSVLLRRALEKHQKQQFQIRRAASMSSIRELSVDPDRSFSHGRRGTTSPSSSESAVTASTDGSESKLSRERVTSVRVYDTLCQLGE